MVVDVASHCDVDFFCGFMVVVGAVAAIADIIVVCLLQWSLLLLL